MHVARPVQHLQGLQYLPSHFKRYPYLLLRTEVPSGLEMIETDAHVLHVDFSQDVGDLNRVNCRKTLLVRKYLCIIIFLHNV